MNKYFILFFIVSATFFSCKKEANKTIGEEIFDKNAPDSLKINQLQYLGSHNSYRMQMDEKVYDFLVANSGSLPSNYNPLELDYEHVSLTEQMTKYGVRQLELDLFLDYNGGKFSNRRLPEILGEDGNANVEELNQPGIKILHIPDVDFNTHNYTLKSALQEIKTWSQKYPEHIPVFILLELSETSIAGSLPGLGFTEVEPWNNAQALQTLENEILDVFSTTNIITPDDVRGNYATLNEAVLAGNWPTIGESRGKVMFLFDKTNIRNTYIQGHPNLEDRVIFTNSYENESDAAFIKINNPLTNLNRIKDLSDKGYLIRTRADEGTWQARNNDYSNWNTALESGAHLISTDYYKADDRAGDGTWSGYYVGFNNGLYQINPQTTD